MSHIDDGMLHAWLDGETSSAEAERVDRHLAGCDACNARLDAVARVHALAGELVASAEDASAPAWEELVARAQAADAAASPSAGHEPFEAGKLVSDRGIAEGETVPPVLPRGVWTPRLLTSGLAWAATLVLAFGVGWYAGVGPDLRPPESEQAMAELDPGARPSAPEQAIADLEPDTEETARAPAVQEPRAAGAIVDALAPATTRTVGEAESAAPAESNTLVRAELQRGATVEPGAVAGQSEDARQVAKTGLEQREVAEADVSETEGLSSVGGARRDNAVKANEAPPVQMRASPARERRALAVADEATSEHFADAAGRSPDADSDSAAIAPQDIAGWLGSEPRRLEGAVLASATVGLLAAGFGDPELPGIWMFFDDPQTGLRVAVAQGGWQQGEAGDQPEPPTGVDAAVLTIAPDGEPQLWWVTADGFLVLVTADADEAMLRNLARRVH